MKTSGSGLREKILETAIALFSEKGMENVKTRELTAALGVSRSHIYHYFSDWTTLSVQACTLFAERDLARFNQQISTLPHRQQLEAFIASHLPQEPDAEWQLYSSLWRKATLESPYAALATTITERWNGAMAAIIEGGMQAGVFRAGDAHQIARQLSAMLNGYADLLIVVTDEHARQQAFEDLHAFIDLAL
ncbi:TetR/AcrR family transcriptional regulator [Pantoea sp. Mb-10]|uniref:TetR/AcrR family transcriptional regulator n=1 Tax=unclassified Pantoea TaxID=2630326 RepID=UPI001E4744DA|nr:MULTISPECIES: TetR/AcrR family transcriptional regulator [unclassified Pantoea]MCE0491231.1 TetR/AcrR family transcriptional regulator [Pantoea sp. Mb-10]MCE0502720.1 TetR/AcrR family transcriptional regulator [Pantoea sp. Pb-8]